MKYKDCPPSIQRMIDDVIRIEGGYSNHKSDTGGETMYGVTIAVARENYYHGDMKDLPKSFAQDVYAKQYFYAPNFHLVAEVSDSLAEECFDSGVNMGPYWPSYWLQQLLNVLNRQQKDYKDIAEDGKIGRQTQQALIEFKNKRGQEGLSVLFNLMNCIQGARYVSLAAKREKNEDFLYGWAAHRLDFIPF